jgi:predicted transcriptional regulator
LRRKLKPNDWYTAAEAALHLGVGAETVKRYLRGENKKLRLAGKQVGPKEEWKLQGSEVIRARKAWKLDG